MIHYKGHNGTIEFDSVNKVWLGRLIENLELEFQGQTVEEAQKVFERKVDIYLKFLAQLKAEIEGDLQ